MFRSIIALGCIVLVAHAAQHVKAGFDEVSLLQSEVQFISGEASCREASCPAKKVAPADDAGSFSSGLGFGDLVGIALGLVAARCLTQCRRGSDDEKENTPAAFVSTQTAKVAETAEAELPPPVLLIRPPAASWQTLADAVKDGDVATCERLLAERRVRLSDGDAWDCTLLHYAAARGNLRIARCLLDSGALASAADAWDETPLHFAARNGHTECCALLLDHGKAAIDAQNAHDWTALMVAAKENKEDACRLLLERGGTTGGVLESALPPLLTRLLFERMIMGGPPRQPVEHSGAPSDDDDEDTPYQ